MFEHIGYKTTWPIRKLGYGLKINKSSYIDIGDLTDYRILGVTSYGQGAVVKRIVEGAALTMKRYQIVSDNQLMWCKVDTKNGAFGVTCKDQVGALASSNMCLADINIEIFDTNFLQMLFRLPSIYEGLTNASLGTTNRKYLRPQEVLEKVRIHLPTLQEQQRIVAKIEQLADKVEQAKNLRQEATNESAAILQSAMNDVWNNTEVWNIKPLKVLVSLVSGQVDPTVDPYATMPHINGESIESGTGSLINNYRSAREDDVKSGKYYFRPDTILYSKIRPYLRKSVFVPFEGVCSADIYAFNSIHSDIAPNFLKYSLISPPFTVYANRISGRTRIPKLNRKQLFAYSLPYPGKDEQICIVNHLDNILLESERIKHLQIQTKTELDALLISILDKAFKGEL